MCHALQIHGSAAIHTNLQTPGALHKPGANGYGEAHKEARRLARVSCVSARRTAEGDL